MIIADFLEGRNQLIFTYGATCSGKTFTIQGMFSTVFSKVSMMKCNLTHDIFS